MAVRIGDCVCVGWLFMSAGVRVGQCLDFSFCGLIIFFMRGGVGWGMCGVWLGWSAL